ncbi:MAG: RNA polymerase sigma factor [Saprospiraceae bacterium]
MEYSLHSEFHEDHVIEAIINKERWAQKHLYEEYYGVLMPICQRYAENDQEAEDILHESFIKIFNNIENYETNTSLKSWMSKIVVNTAIDNYRKNFKKKTVSLDHTYNIKGDEISVLQKMTIDDIIAAIQKLTDIYRTIFNMYVIEGYSHKEIANILKISESTSRSNLVKARKKLKQILAANEKIYVRK